MSPLYNLFVYIVWAFSTYFVVLLLLILFLYRDRLFEKKRPLRSFPLVSVIVPAYNEESKIGETIESLKQLTYPRLEFLIVNDGSKDKTSRVVRSCVKGDKRFTFIDRKENHGKAASLNEAIVKARGEFIACMDADSSAETRIFEKALPYFDADNIGAVTVAVELKRPKKILHRMIDIEYIIGLSLFLKIFSLCDCVFVTPGPFSIYRAGMLKRIGGFDVHNITEDHEIAYRIHKAGYRIVNCLDGKVQTLTPETFKGIYVQRRRWYSGALYTVAAHKDVIFNKRHGLFGLFVPYNYVLIGAGILLFYLSTAMTLTQVGNVLFHYSYTNYNFFEHLLDFNLDLLVVKRIYFVGLSATLFTIFMMIAGLKLTNNSFSTRKLGILTFPYMFICYQIFWTGALWAVIRRRSVSWR
ncbi:glycosyltransferase family 2 protein [Candidatus Woesearchaeota archaeon]|nr:glycosyltransferase family 2 protein [Candidatus Woesearchaeota archaeon]